MKVKVMQPQFLRQTKLEHPSLRTLQETAVLWATEIFNRKGEISPTWLLLTTRGDVDWIETKWENSNEKYRTFDFMASIFYGLNVTCYCLIVEVYVAKYDKVKPNTDPSSLPKPSEMPKEMRDEAMLVIGVDNNGNQCVTRFLVTPRRTGLPILGPRIDVDLTNEHIEGNMFNMFNYVKQ